MKVKYYEDKKGWLYFRCPGCNGIHSVPFINAPPPGPPGVWCYDGKADCPTLSPSLKLGYCHVAVKSGKLYYFSDCKHQLAGTVVPMRDL